MHDSPAVFLLEDIEVHLVWIPASMIRREHLGDGSLNTAEEFLFVLHHTLHTLLRYKHWKYFDIKNISHASNLCCIYSVQISVTLASTKYLLIANNWISASKVNKWALNGINLKVTQFHIKIHITCTYMLFCHHLYDKRTLWHCPPWQESRWDLISSAGASKVMKLPRSQPDTLEQQEHGH